MTTDTRGTLTLFLGMAFLMVSNGLLATLLTLRGAALGFDEASIGLMQSAYPLGALLGCIYAPRLVIASGHARSFAALASIASTASLVHLITSDPWSWSAMRALSGFYFAGLYVVAESWLNGQASNHNRASLLSVYFIIQSGGIAAGQALLNLSSPDGPQLLVLVSILISLALVPLLLVARDAPLFEVTERVSLRELFRISPMGLSGSFLNGISQGALYIGLALYGTAVGLDPGAVGALVGACTIGSVAAQFPIGRLSDRIDRRLVILGCAGLALPLCLALTYLTRTDAPSLIVIAGVAGLGGLVLPIYSLCVAHANDHLRPSQIVAASGTLVLVFNGGIVLGPALSAFALQIFGPTGIFLFVGFVQALTVLATLYRLWRGHERPDTTGTAMPLPQAATPYATHLTPEAAGTNDATLAPGKPTSSPILTEH
ncbi:MFS transporter [Roseibium sp. M-1]